MPGLNLILHQIDLSRFVILVSINSIRIDLDSLTHCEKDKCAISINGDSMHDMHTR